MSVRTHNADADVKGVHIDMLWYIDLSMSVREHELGGDKYQAYRNDNRCKVY